MIYLSARLSARAVRHLLGSCVNSKHKAVGEVLLVGTHHMSSWGCAVAAHPPAAQSSSAETQTLCTLHGALILSGASISVLCYQQGISACTRCSITSRVGQLPQADIFNAYAAAWQRSQAEPPKLTKSCSKQSKTARARAATGSRALIALELGQSAAVQHGYDTLLVVQMHPALTTTVLHVHTLPSQQQSPVSRWV